jgi:hypothetical protein
MTEIETSVIEAAKKWLASKEDILAADEAREDRAETEYAFDQAESELTDAVYRLRAEGRRLRRREANR